MLLAAVFFLGWLVYDAFKLYGAFVGLLVLTLAVGSIFLPYLFWIVAFGYLGCRLAYPPRPRGAEPKAWRQEMKRSDRMPRGAQTRPSARTSLLASEKDAHLEELIAAKDYARALRYAKDQAAEALSRRDFERARVYEKYLERLRRGGK